MGSFRAGRFSSSSLTVMHMGYVDNTTAFVRNANSTVTWAQPANTILFDKTLHKRPHINILQ